GRVLAERGRGVGRGVAVGDQAVDVPVPAPVRLEQVVDRELEVAAGGVHAPDQHLVVQDHVADQVAGREPGDAMAAGDPGQDVDPVEGEGVEEVEGEPG